MDPMASGLDGPVVIVCEGPADARLVRRLIDREQLEGCVTHEAKGFQNFHRVVTGIATSSDRRKLQRLAIICDNDTDPNGRWKNACDALKEEGFVVPCVHGQIADGDPSTAVFMVPTEGVHGALETLLVGAVLEKQPDINDCLNELERCGTGCTEWDDVKKAKMRLQVAIAITCKDDPSSGAAHIWSKKHNPIDVESAAFDELAKFIRTVATF